MNAEIIKTLYKAFSERDLVTLEKICTKDILWTQNPGFPGGGVNTGVKNIIKNVYEANTNRWKYFNFEKSSISENKDTILVEGHYIVQAHGAQEKTRAQTAHVFKIENGQVTSFQQYTDSKTLWDNYSN